MKKQLKIDQILRITQVAKSYEGKMYLLTKNKHVIDPAKFSSLITYLLTVKNGQALNVIIDGPFPHLIVNDLEEICSSTAIKQRQQVLQHSMKIKL
jgi:phosphotransferase system HPr-like phosphotransfer protein